MSTITLEPVINQTFGTDTPGELTLSVSAHVHKRIERFVYTAAVKDDAIPVAYLENEELDSWRNLQIVNRTYSISANSARNSELRSAYIATVGASYTGAYKSIAATDQTYVDEYGKTRPLFWRHELPENVVECELYTVEAGNKIVIDTGFKIDLAASNLYTNYMNFFDADTGAYKLFFVVCTDSSGDVVHQLLNPEPVAKLASWEDIDLTTGMLTTDYPVYSRSQTGSGYTFFFNTSATWYIRPIAKSLIQPVKPSGKSSEDPWFLKFTDGDVSALVNSAVRRYHLPEFDSQPFVPSKPTVFSPYTRLLRVNSHTVAATRGSLSVKPDDSLHLNIFLEDVNGVLQKVLTTDAALEGTRYSDSSVFYESDKILSWDNHGGFIALGIEVHPSWDVQATYYYEAIDLEYTSLNLNPLNNRSIFNQMAVFYVIPNANDADRALHHLLVDHSGCIVYTSQDDEGLSYSNHQVRNKDTSYNSATVIGMKYISDVDPTSWVTDYAAGFANTYGYAVIAEVVVADLGIIEDQFVVDMRRAGGTMVPELFETAIKKNPKILQSIHGYGEDGQEVPENVVVSVKAPLSLLEDYGGNFSQEYAESLLRLHMPSAGYLAIDWEHPASELTGTSLTATEIDLTWTWEGPSQTYKLYRRGSSVDLWVLINTQVSPAEGTITYNDAALTTGDVYYYQVRITENSVEFPAGNSLSIKVI